MTGFSTRDVSELLGLTPKQIRRCARDGLLSPARGPGGAFRFGFQDMVLLRTAQGLREAGVPWRRALKALRELRAAQGSARSLAALRIVADGGRVVVQAQDGLWSAESGQGHLSLAVSTLAGEVAQLPGAEFVPGEDDPDSDDWYNLGLDLEGLDPHRAMDAYRVSLALDPANADAHVNLGRLLQSAGRLTEAQRQYSLALDGSPGHQLALFNLGTLFDESDDPDAAAQCYVRADQVADAHYHLCRIFERRGDEITALRHMRRYRELAKENPS